LSFFESRSNEREVFSKTRRGKLFHKLGRATQLDLKNDRQISIGPEPFKMKRRNLS
jgi:hypothetical protein